MKIEFSWPPAESPNLSVESLAGKISAEYSGLCIRPGRGYRREWETLILEAPGLSDSYVYAVIGGDGRLHETDYCAVVAQIEEALIKFGVNPEISVSGFSLRQYAAQQEKLARCRRDSIRGAIEMIKKTRKLFGKKVFQDIRRLLEQDSADPTY